MQLRLRPLSVRVLGGLSPAPLEGPEMAVAAPPAVGEKEAREPAPRQRKQWQNQTASTTLLAVPPLCSPGWAAPGHLMCHAWAAGLGSQPLSTGPTKAHDRPAVTPRDNTQDKGLLGVGQ